MLLRHEVLVRNFASWWTYSCITVLCGCETWLLCQRGRT